jgi:hypothetical protein
MKRFPFVALVSLALLLLAAACAGPTPAPAVSTSGQAAGGSVNLPGSPVPTAKATSAPAATGLPTAAATSKPVVTSASTAPAATAASARPTVAPAPTGEETLSLTSREAGLDKLKSYRMTWLSEWSSTEAGKTEKVNWNWSEEYASNPEAIHWIWKSLDAGGTSKPVDWEFWQLGDTTYMRTTDEAGKSDCLSFSSEDQKDQMTKGLFNPGMLGSLSDAKYIATETVNGIRAKHYKYNEKSTTLSAFGAVSGDVWVAVDGGFVVKDAVTWSGGAGLLPGTSGSKGDGKWTWELKDVNAPVTIKAPENCGGGASGMPMMKDASEKSTFGDMLLYKTAGPMADVIKFYQAEMPKAGWKATGDPQMMGDELASMEFTNDSKQKASVMITKDNDKVQVMINVTK